MLSRWPSRLAHSTFRSWCSSRAAGTVAHGPGAHNRHPEHSPTAAIATLQQAIASRRLKNAHGSPTLTIWLREELDAHRTHTRHVLRGILRECTYFPDPVAGQWVRQQILSQYRTYEYRVQKQFQDEAFRMKLEAIRRKARQAMHQMRRANEGDRKMLLKALHMAYGRTGRRRHELMVPLLPVAKSEDPPSSSMITSLQGVPKPEDKTDVQETNKPLPKSSKEIGPVKAQIRAFIDNLPPQLLALLESQIRAAPPTETRRNPRRLGFEIPELNTWRKPMPQSRVRNKIKEYYAKLLDQVQVPLPEKEWRRLHDLATGKISYRLPIRRRKDLTPVPSALEMTVMKGKVDKQVFRKDHVRPITPRLMQSVWATVFEQCPLMKYDGENERWEVTWGVHALHSHGPVALKPSETDLGEPGPAPGIDPVIEAT